MSASKYRALLLETQARLAEQTTAAREWQVVATNRLNKLILVDNLLYGQITKLSKLEAIFGIETPELDIPVADQSVRSADEVGRLIESKVTIVCQFIAGLAREAKDTQLALDEVLSICAEAVLVARPRHDLVMSEDHASDDDVFGPVSDVVEDYEDVDPDEDVAVSSGQELVVRPASSPDNDHTKALESLFSRK